jgi:hypothetical protein
MWFWIGFSVGVVAGLCIAWIALAMSEVSRDHEHGGE